MIYETDQDYMDAIADRQNEQEDPSLLSLLEAMPPEGMTFEAWEDQQERFECGPTEDPEGVWL